MLIYKRNSKLSGNEVTSFCTSIHAQRDMNELSTELTLFALFEYAWLRTASDSEPVMCQISENGVSKNQK